MTGRAPRDSMRVRLSQERRQLLLGSLQDFYGELCGDELSEYRAGELLDFFVRELGPPIYNQAIQDARGFMVEKLEDLDAEFHEPEGEDDTTREGPG